MYPDMIYTRSMELKSTGILGRTKNSPHPRFHLLNLDLTPLYTYLYLRRAPVLSSLGHGSNGSLRTKGWNVFRAEPRPLIVPARE